LKNKKTFKLKVKETECKPFNFSERLANEDNFYRYFKGFNSINKYLSGFYFNEKHKNRKE